MKLGAFCYNIDMICNRCGNDKLESLMTKSLGKNGILYTGHVCIDCRNKYVREYQYPKRKIVESNEWFNKRIYEFRHSAKKRGHVMDLSKEQIRQLYSYKKCYYCGEETSSRSIDRVNNSIGYVYDNCVMACLKCNLIKGKIVNADKARVLNILNKLH